MINLSMPVEDKDLIFKLTNDDEFVVFYINELVNNGYISLPEGVHSISRIGEEELSYAGMDNDGANKESQNEWTDAETKVLLSDYELYISKVGPMKRFKTKKAMWSFIADNINESCNVERTGIQVENPYKTVMKRKKAVVDNNSKSGASRMSIPLEEELAKIASVDDSIQPKILRSGNNVRTLKDKNQDVSPRPSTSVAQSTLIISNLEPGTSNPQPGKLKPENGTKNKSLQEVLFELYRLKEEGREKRHKEKLQIIGEIHKKKKQKKNRKKKVVMVECLNLTIRIE